MLDSQIKISNTAAAISTQIGLFDKTSFGRIDEAVEAVDTIQKAASEIEANKSAREVLGDLFRGQETDQRTLNEIINIADGIAEFGLPEPLKRYLFSAEFNERIGRLCNLHEELEDAADDAENAWIAFQEKTVADEIGFLGAKFKTTAVSALLNRVKRAFAERAALSAWIEHSRAWKDCAELELVSLLNAFDFQLPPAMLRKALDRIYYRSLARSVFEQYPGLARMRGVTQKQSRGRFQELDRKILKLHQQSLAAKLARTPIDPGMQTPQRKDYTGLVLIRNELSKKQRHVPVRTLLDRAGPSIQQMKPCFMMSPLSVAQFLKPGGLRFDLLVIDEASQMRPEEALGSIARADQLAIVGDPMQLPPTSFFDTADHVIGTDEDVEEIVDSESILDLSLATYYPPRALLWHYRSRHESLIAFSNRNFYEDKLIVFPSPLDPDKARREPKFGVFHHFVDGKYKSSLNILEAQAVAEAAVAFMREHPDRSLGLVALNQPQREVLLGEIDRLIARDRRARNIKKNGNQLLSRFL